MVNDISLVMYTDTGG